MSWGEIEDEDVLSYFGSKLQIINLHSVKNPEELFQILLRRYNCDFEKIQIAVRKDDANSLSVLEHLCVILINKCKDISINEVLSIIFLLLGNDEKRKISFLRSYYDNPESVLDNELASIRKDLLVVLLMFFYPMIDRQLKSYSSRSIISIVRSSKEFVGSNNLEYTQWKKIIIFDEFDKGQAAGWLFVAMLLDLQTYSANVLSLLYYFAYEKGFLSELLDWMYESGPEYRATLIDICNNNQYGDIDKWLGNEEELKYRHFEISDILSEHRGFVNYLIKVLLNEQCGKDCTWVKDGTTIEQLEYVLGVRKEQPVPFKKIYWTASSNRGPSRPKLFRILYCLGYKCDDTVIDILNDCFIIYNNKNQEEKGFSKYDFKNTANGELRHLPDEETKEIIRKAHIKYYKDTGKEVAFRGLSL